MTDQFNDAAWWKDETLRRDAEIAILKREVAYLKETLRLTNDKMAEQVRQARWEVADVALKREFETGDAVEWLATVREANEPKEPGWAEG